MIKLNITNKIAFISTFPPRMCGIAKYASNVIENMKLASGGIFEPVMFAIDPDDSRKFSDSADFVIRRNYLCDYMEAADVINSAGIDMVFLQHEFGLFGGDAGSYISMMLRRIEVPVITTLHTILNNPDSYYYQSLVEVCDNSSDVVLMNSYGIEMLQTIYGVSHNKITLVPHGIPDIPFNDSRKYKRKLGLTRQKIMLTTGLLSPNKGIELAIEAMLKIKKQNRKVLYIVLGRVHPELSKYEGDAYLNKLKKMVKKLKLSDNVIFLNRFASDSELEDYLAAADVYVTPYTNEEQLTSGMLAFAVGNGKAVVSTPYWAAKELLDEERGTLFPFGDSDKLAEAALKYLNDDVLLKLTQIRAHNYGRKMTWDNVGRQYWQLANSYLSVNAVNSSYAYSH